MLNRTTQILELLIALGEKANFDNDSDAALYESIATSYLSVILYSEVESAVDSILQDRFLNNSDEKIGYFIADVYSKKQGRIKKSDLVDIAQKFGCDCKSEFNDKVDDPAVSFYSNFIQCRHDVAHGTPRAETLTTASNGLSGAKRLLSALEQAIK